MSDEQFQQGASVPMDKVLEKLKNKLADQVVQIAMLESYIDMLQEEKPIRIQEPAQGFREVNKIEDD